MILGGGSNHNSVTYISENFVVQGKREADGTVTLKERNYREPPKWATRSKVLQKLAYYLSDIPLKLLLVITPIATILISECYPIRMIGGLIIALALFVLSKFILPKQRISLRYHGAEHMLFNAQLLGKKLDIQTVKECGRINKQCGSNYIMIIIIFTLVMLPVPISPYIKILIWFILYYGLTKGENKLLGQGSVSNKLYRIPISNSFHLKP